MSLLNRPALAYAISIALVGAVLSPMIGEVPKDSFPLSTFPMFSHKRPATVEIDHVVAIDDNHDVHVVPPQLVAGSEVLQTKAAIAHAVNRGKQARRKLCRDVAARLAQDDDYRRIKRVEVRRDRFNVARYFSESKKPLHTQVFVRCSLPRQAPPRSTAASSAAGSGILRPRLNTTTNPGGANDG